MLWHVRNGPFIIIFYSLYLNVTPAADYYPHMPICKVWIYRLLFVCMCVFVCLFVCLYGYRFHRRD